MVVFGVDVDSSVGDRVTIVGGGCVGGEFRGAKEVFACSLC